MKSILSMSWIVFILTHVRDIGRVPAGIVFAFLGFEASSYAFAQEPLQPQHHSEHLQISRMMKDIVKLSGTDFQGRQAATSGGYKAANFVVERFQELGLHPPVATDETDVWSPWTQQISGTAPRVLTLFHVDFSLVGRSLTQSFMPPLLGRDFLPMFDSPSVNLTAPVVFVGYGIVDPARDIDDYRGVDVHNRIVMTLRGKPPTYGPWVTHEEKLQTAKDHGAAGLITLTGPLLNRYESGKGVGQRPLAVYSATPEFRPIPGIWLDGKWATHLLQSIGLSLERLQQERNEQRNVMPQRLPFIASIQWISQSLPGTLTNILGVLSGEDPTRKDDIIIVGAHRDHFGQQAGLLFPGADDNASGTAVMLELARIFSRYQTPLKHTLVFLSFDGEERGLLGSTHYVRYPAFPLTRTRAMINLDHVGVGNGKLTVGVTRLDRSFVRQAADQAGLENTITLYGYFPGGDHVPFFEAGVPTITIVSSGEHPHFHQPSDTADTIQSGVVHTAAEFAFALIVALDHSL